MLRAGGEEHPRVQGEVMAVISKAKDMRWERAVIASLRKRKS